MKRGREERFMGPQIKRPSPFRRESLQASGEPKRLTTDDALAYLKAVKEMFRDNKEKYDKFLEVMKDFKSQRIDTAGVIARVKDLFMGHRALILGFNNFLPKGYEITLPLEDDRLPKKQPVELDQAINYVNKIKKRFRNDERVYKAFLEMLNMYRKGNKSISDVYQEVALLFCEHQDLLEEFMHFLPDFSCSATVPHPPVSARAQSGLVVKREERTCGLISVRHLHKEKKEKVVDRPDQSFEKTSAKVRNEQWKKFEKGGDWKEDRERKKRYRGDRGLEQNRDRDSNVMQGHHHKQKSARRADEFICMQTQVGGIGVALGGQSVQNSSAEEKKAIKDMYSKELKFLERVKTVLCSHDMHQEFLKCMYMYCNTIINRSQLQKLVAGILIEYPDLMDGFNEFLARFENIDGILAGRISKDFELGNGELAKPIMIQNNKKRDRDCKMENKQEKKQGKRNRENDCVLQCLGKNLSQKVSLRSNKEKCMNKPISQLDLSNCERCTPSYCLLPKNHPKSVASYCTGLGTEVLNEDWVSVISGSEDYSFKLRPKNQYEEILFRCEDDRFELDMKLESTAATTKRVKELLEKLQDGTIKQDDQIQIGDYLTAINLRCIERIYGYHGRDVLGLLRKVPVVALPVILARLQQKQEEWSRCRAGRNKVWAEVYAKSYHKSLDHRSFYFKQQDRRNLSIKALVAEIREINEKKRKEDDGLLAIVAGNKRLLIPHLKYEYPDAGISEDLYQIIKYSCDKVCTTMEQSDKVTRIWTIFLELMFRIPSKPHSTEDMEDVVKANGSHAKRIGEFMEETVTLPNVANISKKQVALTSKSGVDLITEAAVSDSFRLLNGENAVQKGSAHERGQSQHRVDGPFYNCQQDKLQTPVSSADEVANVVRHGNHTERAEESNAGHEVGAESTSGQLGLGHVRGVASEVSRSCDIAVDCVLESKDRDSLRPGESAVRSAGLNRKSWAADLKLDKLKLKYKKYEGVHSRLNVKREGGELSLSRETQDRENMQYGSAGDPDFHQHTPSAVEDDSVGMKCKFGPEENEEVVGEHDTDVDDREESPHKSTDSDNVSEAGEDISGSESGEGDECLHGHHEQEDEDEDCKENGEKAESEGEAKGMAEVHEVEVGTSFALSEHLLFTAKPLAEYGRSITSTDVSEKDSVIFYGHDTFYVLFRLHQILYERILSAKKNALSAEQKWKNVKDTTPPDLYSKFLHSLYSLLDGSIDNAKYEDDCREIIGTQSYMLFTLDKLIFKLVKQLQIIVSDEMATKLLQLHMYERARVSEKHIDPVYHANARILLDGKNLYRFECSYNPTWLSIQLEEGWSEKVEDIANVMEPSFLKYLNNEFLSTATNPKKKHLVFLARNKRKCASDEEYHSMSMAMEDVQVVNGLEYKISCSTSKVSYVLDTQDFLFRKRQKTGKAFAKCSGRHGVISCSYDVKRLCRFHRWIDSVRCSIGA